MFLENKKVLFSWKTIILLLVLVFSSLLFILKPSWEIRGDGHGYYIYLRSLYFDQDLDFTNEIVRYDRLYGTDFQKRSITPINKIGNPFAFGTAIFETPFFLVANFFDAFFYPFVSTDLPGFNIVYQLFLGFGSIIYAIVGVVFLFLALKKLFDDYIAWLSSLFIIFISPLIHYIIYEPLMSHNLSFASNSLLFFFTVKIYKKDEIKLRDVVFIGIAGAISFLIRWQNIIFFLIPFGIITFKFIKRKVSIKHLFVVFFIMFLAISIQLMMWNFLYGSFFTIPQGNNFIGNGNWHLLDFLFSGYHGLFSWHPLLFLGIIGLFLSYKKDKFLVALLFFALILQIFLNSSLSDWYSGSAFGSRKMIGSLFIFAYGLSYLFKYAKNKNKIFRYALALILLLGCGWNFLIMIAAPRGYIGINESLSVKQLYSQPLLMLSNKLDFAK